METIKLSSGVRISTKTKCVECERVFDLRVEKEASEWYYGHDCEA